MYCSTACLFLVSKNLFLRSLNFFNRIQYYENTMTEGIFFSCSYIAKVNLFSYIFVHVCEYSFRMALSKVDYYISVHSLIGSP